MRTAQLLFQYLQLGRDFQEWKSNNVVVYTSALETSLVLVKPSESESGQVWGNAAEWSGNTRCLGGQQTFKAGVGENSEIMAPT